MFHTSGGVTDFRMPEIGPHLVGSALDTPQVPSHVSHHLRSIARTSPPNGVRLDVLIEQLVGIEIRAVAGQEHEANLPPMACHPSCDSTGRMDGMPVDDEKDCAARMPDQPLQEREKDDAGEILAEDHEGQCPAVGDGGDHVASEALSRPGDDRGLSSPPVGGARLMLGSQAPSRRPSTAWPPRVSHPPGWLDTPTSAIVAPPGDPARRPVSRVSVA